MRKTRKIQRIQSLVVINLAWWWTIHGIPSQVFSWDFQCSSDLKPKLARPFELVWKMGFSQPEIKNNKLDHPIKGLARLIIDTGTWLIYSTVLLRLVRREWNFRCMIRSWVPVMTGDVLAPACSNPPPPCMRALTARENITNKDKEEQYSSIMDLKIIPLSKTSLDNLLAYLTNWAYWLYWFILGAADYHDIVYVQ